MAAIDTHHDPVATITGMLVSAEVGGARVQRLRRSQADHDALVARSKPDQVDLTAAGRRVCGVSFAARDETSEGDVVQNGVARTALLAEF